MNLQAMEVGVKGTCRQESVNRVEKWDDPSSFNFKAKHTLAFHYSVEW